MSGSDASSAIFLTDTKNQVKNKINKHAFSGGQQTKELQQELGANLEVDIPYNWLRFFLDDDDEFKRIGEEYQSGRMMSGEIKAILIALLTKIVLDHQEARKSVDFGVLCALEETS